MSLVLLGSTSGSVTLQEPAIAGSTTINLPATSGTMAVLPTATSVLPEASGGTGTTTGYYGFKNRIINGAMVIDQRNAGAEVNPAVNATYYLDRWSVLSTQTSKFKIGQNAGSVTPPAGYTNYLGITSLSSYSVTSTDVFEVRQNIEGFNIADLGYGAAGAATVTLSFWVRSSLTGTFGGALQNSAYNYTYPFTFTISAANTWEQKTITIVGATSGTWLTTNGNGLRVVFGLGVGSTYSGTAGAWAGTEYHSATGAVSVVGTNSATFYLTGVQLEKGSTATSFDYRPYGTELALCQRYYYRTTVGVANAPFGPAWGYLTTQAYATVQYPVSMRDIPSALEQSGTASNYGLFLGATAVTCSAVPAYTYATTQNMLIAFTVASGITVGQGGYARGLVTTAYLGWSAEL